jgi:hypothetical protein
MAVWGRAAFASRTTTEGASAFLARGGGSGDRRRDGILATGEIESDPVEGIDVGMAGSSVCAMINAGFPRGETLALGGDEGDILAREVTVRGEDKSLRRSRGDLHIREYY